MQQLRKRRRGVVADTAKRGKKRRREKKQRKRIEDAVQYALAHKIRVEILILLNEASYTVAEVAELIDIPISNVSNHIRRMLDDGSIEVGKRKTRRGTIVHWYRAVELPYYSKEEAETLTEMERQVTAGLVVQSGLAEVMAALFKGYLADFRTILSWDWYNVDRQGRDDLEAENLRHLDRIREIECEAINRCAESGEETTPILVSLFSFVRARKPRRPGSRSCEPKSAN
jgi:DNA-binding transcriptional ArsR family regulator